MNEIKNGVVYCDPPIKTDLVQFLFEHLDCDCVIKEQSLSSYTVYVIAYAESKQGNSELHNVYYNNHEVMIVHGIGKEEVSIID